MTPHHFGTESAMPANRMNTDNLIDLYKKECFDETITKFENEAGFSVIRFYPKDTIYYEDGRRMFIKIGLLENGFFFEINMTKSIERNGKTEYIILHGDEYKGATTNFFSDGEEFTFNEGTGKVVHLKTKKVFSLNEFINILEANHLTDRAYWGKKLRFLSNFLLEVVFWFADKHYEKVRVSMDRYTFARENNKQIYEESKAIEPFFKYFRISKNLIFSVLSFSFLVLVLILIFWEHIIPTLWPSSLGEFTVSNPVVILVVFLALFSAEKISVFLDKNINEFLMPNSNNFNKTKENLIEKMHNFQYQNKFNVSLSLKSPRRDSY